MTLKEKKNAMPRKKGKKKAEHQRGEGAVGVGIGS